MSEPVVVVVVVVVAGALAWRHGTVFPSATLVGGGVVLKRPSP